MPPPLPPVATPESPLLFVGDLVLYAATPAIVLFSAFYFFRSNWRATQAGQAILWLANSLSVTLLLAVMTRIFGPDWPLREWVRIVVYGAVTYAIWRLLITLLRIQHREHKEKGTQSDDSSAA